MYRKFANRVFCLFIAQIIYKVKKKTKTGASKYKENNLIKISRKPFEF